MPVHISGARLSVRDSPPPLCSISFCLCHNYHNLSSVIILPLRTSPNRSVTDRLSLRFNVETFSRSGPVGGGETISSAGSEPALDSPADN